MAILANGNYVHNDLDKKYWFHGFSVNESFTLVVMEIEKELNIAGATFLP